MKLARWTFYAYCFLIVFSIVGSAASTWFNIDPGPIRPVAGFLVIVSGTLCISLELQCWSALAWIAGVAVVAETIGLYTGMPFGFYEYTGRWWPSIPIGFHHTFPVLLPLAWIMIVGGSFSFASRCLFGWKSVVVAGLLATAIDAPMERAMTDVFHYWTWRSTGPIFGAPVLNSVGWFLISCLAAIGLLRANCKKSSYTYSTLVLTQFCAFVVISGTVAFFDPAWVALAGLVTLLAVFRRPGC